MSGGKERIKLVERGYGGSRRVDVPLNDTGISSGAITSMAIICSY